MFKKYLIIGLIFLLAFLGLAILVKKQLVSQFDFDTTVRTQNHIPQSADPLLSAFSLIGSFEIMSAVVLLWWFISHTRLAGLPVLVVYTLGLFVELAGKVFLNHSGPPFMFFRYDLDFIFPSGYVQTGNSFPSGHSFRAVFLAVLLIYQFRRKPVVWFLITILATAMLISRVSLGEHWASDVAGGALLGLSLASLSLSWLTVKQK